MALAAAAFVLALGSSVAHTNPGDVFVVGVTSSVTAGNSFDVTLEAQDNGSPDTTYSGTKTIDWGGGTPAPDTTPPSYPEVSVVFVNGVATTPLSATYFAAGSATLTATDTAATGITGIANFTVNPGPLFSVSVSTPSGVSAGTQFSVDVKAHDQWGNGALGWVSTDGCVAFTGPLASPNNTMPIYPATGGGCLSSESDLLFDGTGKAPALIKLFNAASTTLTATGGGMSGSTSAFPVAPGLLHHFAVAKTVAGAETVNGSFSVQVGARDQWGNAPTAWTTATQCVVFSGALPSPDNTSPSYPAPGGGCTLGQSGLSFDVNGDATGSVTLFKAASTTLTVTDAASSANGSVGPFTVNPGPLFSVSVSTPSGVSAGTQFSVDVKAHDQWGNGALGWVSTDGCVAFTGPLASPNNTMPIYPATGGGCLSSESDLLFDGTGKAPALIKLFNAASTTLTATGGGMSGSTSAFPVAPGLLFSVSVSTPSGVTAGTLFSVDVKAHDQWGNGALGWVSTDGCVAFTGPLASPNNTMPIYPATGGGCLSSESDLSFDGTGKAPASIRIFKAVPTILTVSGGSKNGSTNSFAVMPGPLGSFAWTQQPPVSPTAGVAFGAVVTAYDLYGNVKTDYTGAAATGATLTGLGTSPAPPAIFLPHGGSNGPSYGSFNSWPNGVGTITSVTDRKAETTALTITDGSVHAASWTFTVNPATPDALRFTEQPTEAAPNAFIHGTTSATTPVTVQAIDQFANLASNTSIKMAIGANPGPGATLGGSGPKSTDSTGTATFDALTINKVGVGYTLVATAPPPPASPNATQTSTGFTIAQSVGTCPGGTCSGQAAITNQSTLNVNATGTTTANTLGVALAPTTIPGGVCPGFKDAQPQGLTPGAVNVNYGTNQASLTLTWTISKAVRNAISDNGLAHYNICLGGINLSDPSRLIGPTPVDPSPGFATKTSARCPTNGITAARACPVWDTVFQAWFYWGVIPDCTSTSTGPCMVSRATGSGGTVILTFKVPAPWDPLPHGGS